MKVSKSVTEKSAAKNTEMHITISSFDGNNSYEKVIEGSDVLGLKNSFPEVAKKMAATFSLIGSFSLETIFMTNGEYHDSDCGEIIFNSNGEITDIVM